MLNPAPTPSATQSNSAQASFLKEPNMPRIPAELVPLLGRESSAVTSADLQKLVSVSESDQFDAKGEMWGGSDSEKREFAKDVAALANHTGGLIVVGAQEDQDSKVAQVESCELRDDEWISKVLANNLAPYLGGVVVDRIDDSNNPGKGWLLVSVPRSPDGPHGVMINEGFRFPKRDGTTTRWLSITELRDAFAAQVRRSTHDDEQLELMLELVRRYPLSDRCPPILLEVSATPSFAGDLSISAETVRTTFDWYEQIRESVPRTALPPIRSSDTQVGLHRLIVGQVVGEDSGDSWYSLVSELHTDGDTALRLAIPSFDRDDESESPSQILHEYLPSRLIAVLALCSAHARRAGAGGDLSLRMEISHRQTSIILAKEGYGGTYPEEGSRSLLEVPVIEVTVPVLPPLSADSGSIYVEAVALLLDRLANAFGLPESRLTSRDGSFLGYNFEKGPGSERVRDHGEALKEWASKSGVEFVEVRPS